MIALRISCGLVLALAGCNPSSPSCDAGDGGDCGVLPPPADAGTPDGGPADAGPPVLTVGTSGIYVTDMPVSPERSVEGDVLVQLGEEIAVGATVRINGVTLPPSSLGEGFFDVGPETGLVAGSHAVMVASLTVGGTLHEAQVEFDCPQTTLTSPAAGTFFRSGDTAHMTWTPPLEHESVFGPVAGIYACFTQPTGSEVSRIGHGDWFLDLSAGASSADVPIDTDCARYVLELRVAGEATLGTHNSLGLCYTQVRVQAVGPAP